MRSIPLIWLDVTYFKCRCGGRAASTAAVTAIGCDESGWRQVLGVSVVDTESHDSWLGFLHAPRDRGASGNEFVRIRCPRGLVRAIGEVFQGGGLAAMRDCMREAGSWQLRRRVGQHLLFGLPRQVRRHRRGHVPRGVRDAGGVLPGAARALEEAEPDALAHLDFPPSHWKRLRTNNLRERAKRETKRGSRVVQVFPSESSLLRLVGAVMCDQAETWAGSRYFSERKMAEMHDAELRRGALGCHDWAEPGKTDRKMVESSLELADGVETA